LDLLAALSVLIITYKVVVLEGRFKFKNKRKFDDM